MCSYFPRLCGSEIWIRMPDPVLWSWSPSLVPSPLPRVHPTHSNGCFDLPSPALPRKALRRCFPSLHGWCVHGATLFHGRCPLNRTASAHLIGSVSHPAKRPAFSSYLGQPESIIHRTSRISVESSSQAQDFEKRNNTYTKKRGGIFFWEKRDTEVVIWDELAQNNTK